MKKNIFKKIFIKFSKLLGFEIIDQSEFNSPTLNKELNKELSNIKKSIVLPLGEVKLTRKIQSLSIIFRTNTNIEIWDQNKKRIFEKPKIEYALRCLNSVIKSIKKNTDREPSTIKSHKSGLNIQYLSIPRHPGKTTTQTLFQQGAQGASTQLLHFPTG